MNKHDATEKAIRIADIYDEIERLEKLYGIDKLESELKDLRKDLDEFTGKRTTSLIGGVEVVYTMKRNFNKKLFNAEYPEINLDDNKFKAETYAFKCVTRG